MSHVVDRLADYVLGALPNAESAEVERHLAECPRCAGESRLLFDAVNGVAVALPPIAPAPSIRARLLAAAAARGRLTSSIPWVASFFGISQVRAGALLEAVDEPSAWEAGPLPGVGLIHFNGAGRFTHADNGLVRFPARMAWPAHKHLGDEHMLIIEGGIRDDQGQSFREGSSLSMGPGSTHSFDVLPESDCVAGVILLAGIEFV